MISAAYSQAVRKTMPRRASYRCRRFLRDTGLFDDNEILSISNAVKNHSSKTVAGTPIDEIVKDADVIDCYQYGLPFDRPEKKTRYENWLAAHA